MCECACASSFFYVGKHISFEHKFSLAIVFLVWGACITMCFFDVLSTIWSIRSRNSYIILAIRFTSSSSLLLLLLNLSKSKANQIRNLDTNTFAHLTLLSCCVCGVFVVVCACLWETLNLNSNLTIDRINEHIVSHLLLHLNFFSLPCVCELCVSQRSLSSRF